MSDDKGVFLRFALLSGAPKSGRKTLLLRYIHDKYFPNYEPTIDDYYKKRTIIRSRNYTLELILVENHTDYRAMRELAIKSAEGFLLFYSVDKTEGFDNIPQLFEEIYSHRQEKVPIIIVGAKCDLAERQVSKEQGEELARRLNIQHVEVSAKNNINVADCFAALVQELDELNLKLSQRDKKKDKEKCIIC